MTWTIYSNSERLEQFLKKIIFYYPITRGFSILIRWKNWLLIETNNWNVATGISCKTCLDSYKMPQIKDSVYLGTVRTYRSKEKSTLNVSLLDLIAFGQKVNLVWLKPSKVYIAGYYFLKIWLQQRLPYFYLHQYSLGQKGQRP